MVVAVVKSELLLSRLEESINLLIVASKSATSHESGGAGPTPPRSSTEPAMAAVTVVVEERLMMNLGLTVGEVIIKKLMTMVVTSGSSRSEKKP